MNRNPYVILGLSFGATADEAAVAFARKARGLRRVPGGAERLQDLTWALNQLQEKLKDARLAIDVYRIPANPLAFRPGGQGALRPPPERMERTSGGSDHEWAALLSQARMEALAVLRRDVASVSALPRR
jgi:hypothetical protein